MINRRIFLGGTATALTLSSLSAFAQTKDPAKLRVARCCQTKTQRR